MHFSVSAPKTQWHANSEESVESGEKQCQKRAHTLRDTQGHTNRVITVYNSHAPMKCPAAFSSETDVTPGQKDRCKQLHTAVMCHML